MRPVAVYDRPATNRCSATTCENPVASRFSAAPVFRTTPHLAWSAGLLLTGDAVRTPIRFVNAAVLKIGSAPAGWAMNFLRAYTQQVRRAHRGPRPVKDITAAVRKAGYQSRDKELWRTVGKHLRKMREIVKVRPGVFQIK